MQETASNLIGRYFKWQPQQPQVKKHENYLKNEHPLLIKFATDPYMGAKVEGSIDKKITFEMNNITLPKKLFIVVLKELERLRSLEEMNKVLQEKVDQQNKQIEELSAQSQQIKNTFLLFEKEEERAKELLNNKIKVLTEELEQRVKELESYKITTKEQEEELNSLKEENSELESRLESSVNEFQIVKTKLSDLYFEYTKYKSMIECYRLNGTKEVKESDINITKIQQVKDVSEIKFEKTVNLDYIFHEKFGERVCEYLDYKDILNLKLVGKFLYLTINNSSKYYVLVAKQMKRKWIDIKEGLLKRINCNKELAAKIPEPYVKHAFSKYIWHKETVGEYMITSIIQAENFFNLLLDYEEEPTKDSSKTESTGMSFLKKIAKKIDDVKTANLQASKLLTGSALEQYMPHNSKMTLSPQSNTEVHNMSSNQSDVPPILMTPESQKSNNASHLATPENSDHGFTTPSKSAHKDLEDVEDLFELPESKRQLFSTYYANNPFCVFIPGDAYRNPGEDKKQMLLKASTYVEDMLRALIKRRSVLTENKDILSQLLQIFTKMLIFSKVLLQESKELEALKDYVISKYEEIKLKLSKFENSVEDYGEALQAEKQLKEFFSKKATELEAQLQTKNAKILKDSETLVSLQNQLKGLEETTQKLAKEKQDQESKLKVLVKEVKSLRTKNKEFEDMQNHVMTGYYDIKIIFDNLDLDI